jgi:hypothetical protein
MSNISGLRRKAAIRPATLQLIGAWQRRPWMAP